jgi:predicted transcriptional regulator
MRDSRDADDEGSDCTVGTRSSVFRDVLGSTVRTDVLVAVAADARPTKRLVETVDASESAVYNAVDDLRNQGLVRSVEGRCETTGSGQVVADHLEHQSELCRLLSEPYWESHDTAVLPERFRLRLPELSGADVFHASDTEPHAAIREICDRIETGSPDVDVISPIYQPEYEEVMPDASEARLLLGTEVATRLLATIDDPEEASEFEHTSVCILDVDVAMGITDEHLMLSLPTLDGQYDSRTELFATDDRALAWGRDVFEHYWNRGRPEEAFLADYDF